MKKTKVCIAALIPLALLSCGNNEKDIVGGWELTKMTKAGKEIKVGDNVMVVMEVFSPDGEWVSAGIVGPKGFCSFDSSAGEYEIKGDSIIITSKYITFGKQKVMTPNNIIRRKIKKLNGDKLVFTQDDIEAEMKKTKEYGQK